MIRRLTSAVGLALVTSLLAAACGGTTVSEITGPDIVRCQTSVSNAPPVPAAGGQVTVSVTAARECTWNASTDASWLRLSPTSGQGAGSVTVTASANTAAAPRSGTIVLNDARVAIAQEPAPCRYELGSTSARMPAEGGRTSVRVSALDDCTWTASSTTGWVRVLTPSGRGNGSVDLQVDRNDGAQRTAEITVAGTRFTIVQDNPPPPPPPSPSPAPTPPGPAPNPSPSPGPNPTPGPSPGPAPSPGPQPVPPPTPTPVPSPVGEVKDEGRVTDLRGSCPSITFRLGSRTFYADSRTRFKGSCGAIRNGVKVEVKGTLMSDGRVRADEIDIDD